MRPGPRSGLATLDKLGTGGKGQIPDIANCAVSFDPADGVVSGSGLIASGRWFGVVRDWRR